MKERKIWLFVIPRDNIPDHKDTVVCEEDWSADYLKVIYYRKERPEIGV